MEINRAKAVELLAELAHDLLARWSTAEYDSIVEYCGGADEGDVESLDREAERISNRIDYLASVAAPSEVESDG